MNIKLLCVCVCTCGDIVVDSFNGNRSVWNGVSLEITNKSCYSSVNLRRTWGIKKDEKTPPSNPDSWVWAFQKTKQLSPPVSTRHVKAKFWGVPALYSWPVSCGSGPSTAWVSPQEETYHSSAPEWSQNNYCSDSWSPAYLTEREKKKHQRLTTDSECHCSWWFCICI